MGKNCLFEWLLRCNEKNCRKYFSYIVVSIAFFLISACNNASYITPSALAPERETNVRMATADLESTFTPIPINTETENPISTPTLALTVASPASTLDEESVDAQEGEFGVPANGSGVDLKQVMSNEEIEKNIRFFMGYPENEMMEYISDYGLYCLNNRSYTDDPCISVDGLNEVIKMPHANDFYFVSMDGSEDQLVYTQVEGILLGIKTIKSVEDLGLLDPILYDVMLLGHVLPNNQRIVMPYVYSISLDKTEMPAGNLTQEGMVLNAYKRSYFPDGQISLPTAILEGMTYKSPDALKQELLLAMNKPIYTSIVHGKFMNSSNKAISLFVNKAGMCGEEQSKNIISIYRRESDSVLRVDMYKIVLENYSLPFDALKIPSVHGLSYFDDAMPIGE